MNLKFNFRGFGVNFEGSRGQHLTIELFLSRVTYLKHIFTAFEDTRKMRMHILQNITNPPVLIIKDKKKKSLMGSIKKMVYMIRRSPILDISGVWEFPKTPTWNADCRFSGSASSSRASHKTASECNTLICQAINRRQN